MSVFGDYSKYYDLLYHDKDYKREAAFIGQILDRFAPGGRKILELGCGSGRHAALLAAAGYEVHGVDRSAQMLEEARARTAMLPAEVAGRLSWEQGDVRTYRAGRTFDIVVSLFHVVSYQTSAQDLCDTFATAAEHLSGGGVFVFDCWYGPAVLSDPPRVRVKRAAQDTVKLTRLCEPTLRFNENLVDIDYTLFVDCDGQGVTEQLHERHCMRYLFRPEVDLLLADVAMERVGFGEWMTDKDPEQSSFGVYFVGRKADTST